MSIRRDEILQVLTLATLDVLREPDKENTIFPSKEAIRRRANEKYGSIGATQSALPDGIWTDVARRFRVVFDPPDYKAESVRQAFGIREMRVATSLATIPDEAARLHVDMVEHDATCFYSCGNTLAEMVRRTASSGMFGSKFTACSSVVLATDAPSALPPSAITAEFQRSGKVKTLSYLLPLALQEHLDLDDNAERRRWLRDSIEKAVFERAREASFLFLGIGSLEQPGSFTDHCNALDALKALVDKGAVAEVGFMPVSANHRLLYDELGLAKQADRSGDGWKVLDPPLRRFFNSTYVLKFPLLPPKIEVVVVAGGKEKHLAIWHGLQFLSRPRSEGGLGEIAYFVCDVATVDALYDQLRRSAPPTSNRSTVELQLSLRSELLPRLERLAAERGCSVDALLGDAVKKLL